MHEQDILFELRGRVGLVALNRPKALNALTLEMCQTFEHQLATWTGDPAVSAVVVEGAGERAFCAGGDVRAIWQAGKNGEPLTADFFRAEYRLNRRIKVFPKPYIALVDGIAMGGGLGVSMHGSHRIVTERSVLAMPETRIGLFPDVGASHLLPRLPGALGCYLGLTGARLKAADSLYVGLATHFVPSARIAELAAALAVVDWRSGEPQAIASALIGRFTTDPPPPPLAAQRATIERCFAKESVEEVLAALAVEDGPWAAEALATLRACSPTSLKVTLEELRRGARLSFDAAMVMEYRLSQACMARHDFYEGIRAVVIDKDNAPAWQPATLEGVTPALVEAHFEAPAAGDLTFE